jgi:hypothetical protein
VPDGGPHGDAAAQRVAHNVGSFEAEVPDQGCDVVRHQLDAERAVDVGGAPVGLQIGCNDPPAFREQRQDLAGHLDRADAAVQ